MSIQLVCGDGVDVRLRRDHFEKCLFKNADIEMARSYALQCKARSKTVNALLDWIEGESTELTITEDNFYELQSLCRELGFSGLDKQLGEFRDKPGDVTSNVKEFLLLNERITRHDKRLAEIQRQLNDILSWKLKTEAEIQESVLRQLQSLERKIEKVAGVCEERHVEVSSWKRKTKSEIQESVSRQFHSLERKIEEVAQLCERGNVEASRTVERMPKECAKRSDLEELTRDATQLKASENATRVRSPDDGQTKRSALPPLKRPVTAKPAPLKLKHGKEILYNIRKEKLDGIIAYLTRECGGDVYKNGIVYVVADKVNDERPQNVVNFGTNACYGMSECQAWICYDFRNRRVIPTSYSLKSNLGRIQLKSWVIEVSNDGYSWMEIDRRENNTDLDDNYVTVNFKVSHVPGEGFRFFRLRQTGPSHRGNYEAKITAIELFGTLFVIDKEPQPQKQEFLYHAEREGLLPPPVFPPKLDGIIRHLALQCCGNVHKKGIVNVTASSVLDSDYMSCDPKNAVDFDRDSSFSSHNEPNSWICCDFKDRRVIPTSYSVRSGYSPPYLRSWVIEVSNDGTENSWTEIDRRDDWDGDEETPNFEISRIPRESFRFFRLRQTGKNRDGENYLKIYWLEIFGTLFEK